MKEQLEKRLAELKAEFETGQKQLEALENQANTLRQTLLRISGAIQVLEEEIARDGASQKANDAP
jgi:prefoldin subunit 5